MKALLVGAGAVGQVYARHLALAGVDVSFLVKPKHAEEARRGFTMYPLRKRDRYDPVELRVKQVLTSLDEAGAARWDQVWLCLPTDAIEAEGYLSSLAAAIGEATLVYLQPGGHVPARMRAHFAEARLVAGAIGMVSYYAPLGDEEVPKPGVAYAFPLGSKTQFSGARAHEAADPLRRGGCPAKVVRDARVMLSKTGAIIQPFVVSLEGAGWRFAALSKSALLPIALRAMRQTLPIAAALGGYRAPAARLLIRPFVARIALKIAPFLATFDFERYLQVHFSKVGAQTRLLLPSYVSEGKRLGLPADAVTQLAEAVFGAGEG